MNNCLNCKYYYNRQCNNKTLPIQSKITIKDQVIEFIEEGYLNEYLKETLTSKELKRIFLNTFIHKIINKDYIKKAKLTNLQQELYSEDEEEIIIEEIDSIISIMLKRFFKNEVVGIEITEPGEFCCNNWE